MLKYPHVHTHDQACQIDGSFDGWAQSGPIPVLPFVYSEHKVTNCNFHLRYIIEIDIIIIKGSFALFAFPWGTNVTE